MKINRILPDGPLGTGTEMVKIPEENDHLRFLGEVYGICSLIFLSDIYQIQSVEDAKDVIKSACQSQRGYGQMLLYAFHPQYYPGVSGFLGGAGWKKLTEWPSAHPGVPPMELWGVLTGQEQH